MHHTNIGPQLGGVTITVIAMMMRLAVLTTDSGSRKQRNEEHFAGLRTGLA